jgi:uncharacterized membrane protein YqaE (UPF0057 family)
MKTTTYLLALLVAFVFSSCGMFNDLSIEKRHYRKGYYVHKRDDRSTENAVVKDEQVTEENTTVAKTGEENNTSVVENSTQQLPSSSTEKSFVKEKIKNFSPVQTVKKAKERLRDKISSATSTTNSASPADDDDEHVVALFLLIILAIILPPLAVLLADGVGINFLVDLIFWLLGFGFVIFIAGTGYVYLGIFGLIAIIYALFVVFDVI